VVPLPQTGGTGRLAPGMMLMKSAWVAPGMNSNQEPGAAAAQKPV
jgi:hypothetical protein